MKPICVPCERFMRPLKTGYWFVEGMPGPERNGTGKGATGWISYKVWVGDLWHCPDCGAQTIVGIGSGPVSEHYKPDFHRAIADNNALQLVVKDC
jgi:hypothetical protein